MTNDLNDYQYRHQQGYEMAIMEIEPILREVLKIIAKPNKTRDGIREYLKHNPNEKWAKIASALELSSNQLIAHHLPRIKLINRIEGLIKGEIVNETRLLK